MASFTEISAEGKEQVSISRVVELQNLLDGASKAELDAMLSEIERKINCLSAQQGSVSQPSVGLLDLQFPSDAASRCVNLALIDAAARKVSSILYIYLYLVF